MIYSIYRITNKTNGKVYIGFTSLNPQTRLRQHRQYAFNTNRKGKLLYKAIEKYTPDGFYYDVIYQSKDREHALAMETYFITEYRAWVDFPDAHGYNLTLGGRQAVKSAKSVAAQREKMLGRKQTPEHASKKGFGVNVNNPSYKGMPARQRTQEEIDRQAATMKAYYANGGQHPWVGRSHTEDSKAAISAKNRKTYHIIDTKGNRYETDDLPDFAGRHGFNKDTIRNYSRRGDWLKGYKIEYTMNQKGKKSVYGQ